jgi:hypothetical protein
MLAVDREGRTTFVAAAQRDDGNNELLTAFLELETTVF